MSWHADRRVSLMEPLLRLLYQCSPGGSDPPWGQGRRDTMTPQSPLGVSRLMDCVALGRITGDQSDHRIRCHLYSDAAEPDQQVGSSGHLCKVMHAVKLVVTRP